MRNLLASRGTQWIVVEPLLCRITRQPYLGIRDPRFKTDPSKAQGSRRGQGYLAFPTPAQDTLPVHKCRMKTPKLSKHVCTRSIKLQQIHYLSCDLEFTQLGGRMVGSSGPSRQVQIRHSESPRGAELGPVSRKEMGLGCGECHGSGANRSIEELQDQVAASTYPARQHICLCNLDVRGARAISRPQ